MKGDLKERYLQAKQQDAIITSLENHAPVLSPKQTTSTSKASTETNWQPELDILTQVSSKLRGGNGQNPINGPAFSLVKASIALANSAINEPQDLDALYQAIKKAERSLKQVMGTFYRID